MQTTRQKGKSLAMNIFSLSSLWETHAPDICKTTQSAFQCFKPFRPEIRRFKIGKYWSRISGAAPKPSFHSYSDENAVCTHINLASFAGFGLNAAHQPFIAFSKPSWTTGSNAKNKTTYQRDVVLITPETVAQYLSQIELLAINTVDAIVQETTVTPLLRDRLYTLLQNVLSDPEIQKITHSDAFTVIAAMTEGMNKALQFEDKASKNTKKLLEELENLSHDYWYLLTAKEDLKTFSTLCSVTLKTANANTKEHILKRYAHSDIETFPPVIQQQDTQKALVFGFARPLPTAGQIGRPAIKLSDPGFPQALSIH